MKNHNQKLLAHLSIINNGDWGKIYADITSKKDITIENEPLEDYITILDNNYPERLKNVYRPPFCLFYKGNISLLNNNNIIALGVDELWDYSWDTLENLLDFTGEHQYIISGNRPVSKGFAKSFKNLIVVLNVGFNKADSELVDIVLANGGLVLTEMPDGAEREGTDHTRIISALENKLVVVHCDNRGFAIRQVMNSLNLGHKIYAMPTPLDSVKESKNNQLLAEGAMCFYDKMQLAE